MREHPLYQHGLARVRQGMSIEQVLNWMYGYAKEVTKSDWKVGLAPDDIEARQASMAHEWWDLLWDDFNSAERLAIAATFREVVLHPEAYPNLFEPDDYFAMERPGLWRRLQRFVRNKEAGELI